MSHPPQIRLHLFFAQDNDRAVILRQGPSKLYRMSLWHRDSDVIEHGQWLKHKVYAERCSLSPDGQHFLFFALDGKWGSDAKGSYTAISQPPYFTALALYPQGDTWGGGGVFLSNQHYAVDGCGGSDIMGRAKGLTRVDRGSPSPLSLSIQDTEQLAQVTQDEVARRGYHTKAGQLFRRNGAELTLIEDFTDMEFEPMRALYDDAPDDEPAAWHPLQRDRS